MAPLPIPGAQIANQLHGPVKPTLESLEQAGALGRFKKMVGQLKSKIKRRGFKLAQEFLKRHETDPGRIITQTFSKNPKTAEKISSLVLKRVSRFGWITGKIQTNLEKFLRNVDTKARLNIEESLYNISKTIELSKNDQTRKAYLRVLFAAKDDKGRTLAQLAAKHGSLETVVMLVKLAQDNNIPVAEVLEPNNGKPSVLDYAMGKHEDKANPEDILGSLSSTYGPGEEVRYRGFTQLELVEYLSSIS